MDLIHFPVTVSGDCPNLPCRLCNRWNLYSWTRDCLVSVVQVTELLGDDIIDNVFLLDLTGEFFKNPLKLFEKNDDSSPYQLNIFGTDPFESYQSSDATTDAASESQVGNADHAQDDIQALEDIWSLDQLSRVPEYKPKLRSWENYYDPSFQEPISTSFSESGAKGFDAALSHQATTSGLEDSGRVVRNEIFFQALFRLGLGWNSIFFRYNHQKRRFEKDPIDIRISGVSLPTLNSMVDEIQQCGTDILRVRTFVCSNAVKSNELPALFTFASAAAVIVYTLETQISRHFANLNYSISLLRIKLLFQRCGELVGALVSMVDAVEKATSDAQAISIILDRAAYFSQRYVWMERLFNEMVIRVTQPWLNFVEAWIGLRSEEPTFVELMKSGRNFVELEHVEETWRINSRPARIEYRYHPDQIPSLIPAEQAQLIFESGRSLRLLKRSHPQHPIVNNGILCSALPPRLHCAIAWPDIERIQSRAQEYEAKLRAEILKYNRGKIPENTADSFKSPDLANVDGTFNNTYEMFDIDDRQHMTGLLASCSSVENDKLGLLLDATSEQVDGNEGSFGPELTSALYLSLAPVISSQALLIDFSCLHLLFKEHKIRDHLTLQWRFQLLGDGFFACRLSNVLFDPQMESGERRLGVMRSGVHTGLRLGSRDTWPPASSEIRLVLISLLSECYSADEDGHVTADTLEHDDKELPGGLSFSIRDLNDEELVKCKDPNAIEALDFLRLQYKPSSVLEIILTFHSLHQYDMLFKHLLRLLRMVSVVKGLIRDSTSRSSLVGDTRNIIQKFRIEAQHFVLAVSDYCFNIAIGSTWQRFQDTLSRIEHCLDKGDIDGTIEAAQSVPRLREFHENTLDQMLFALFLSKRHDQVAKLLESVFGTILAFAPFSKLDGVSGVRYEKGNEEAVVRLYASFRKRVGAFVRFLRQLDGGKSASSSKRSMGGSSGAGPMNVFEHLLVRLDMKRYY